MIRPNLIWLFWIIGSNADNSTNSVTNSIRTGKNDTSLVNNGLQNELKELHQSSLCNYYVNACSGNQNLHPRNCMCDEKCLLYNDCCQDSKFLSNQTMQPANFSCVSTAVNGHVYMKTKCLPSWNQSTDVQENCETDNQLLLTLDVWLFTPVTDRETDIVYKNMFCAFCNGAENFDFWKIGFFCQAKDDYSLAFKPAQTPQLPNHISLLANLKPNETPPGFWESYVGNVAYHCSLHGKLGEQDSKNLRRCVPSTELDSRRQLANSDRKNGAQFTALAINVTSSQHLKKYEYNVSSSPGKCGGGPPTAVRKTDSPYTVDIFNPLLIKVPRCHQIPPDTAIYHKLCNQSEPPPHKHTCINEKCLIDGIFHNNTDVVLLANGTLFLKGRRLNYPPTEYLVLNGTSLVYICGSYIPRTPFQEFVATLDDWSSEILIKFSMLCLLLHLLVFAQLPAMKNLCGKNLAVFCGTLFAAFICYEIGPRLPRCDVTAVILHFSLLSCFTWSLVMAYDCWHSLCLATKKLRATSGAHRWVRFCVYCAICLALPALVVSVALYFELAPSTVIPCHIKLGYGKHKDCFISQTFGLFAFFIAPASTIFFGDICFFAHTSYMIYRSQKSSVNPNTRNDFLMYLRLALMMGLTWTLGTVVFITENAIIGLVFSVMNMSQGILIFFAFTCKRKILKQLLEVHEKNPKIASILKLLVRESSISNVPTQLTHIESSSG